MSACSPSCNYFYGQSQANNYWFIQRLAEYPRVNIVIAGFVDQDYAQAVIGPYLR